MKQGNLYNKILQEVGQKAINIYLTTGNVYTKDYLESLVEAEFVKQMIKKLKNELYEIKKSSKENLMTKDEQAQVDLWKESLHGLDLNDEKDKKIYDSIRFDFITKHEGTHPVGKENDKTGKTYQAGEAYKDSKGILTVGYGFNMKRSKEGEAEKEWNDAFKSVSEDEKPNFEEIKNGQSKLTGEEMKILFNHSVNIRENELKNKYEQTWKKMAPNEKLMTESLYYNGGDRLVGLKTDYFENMEEYIKRGEKTYLDKIYTEVNEKSNPSLQISRARRHAEAEIGYSVSLGDKYINPTQRNKDGTNNQFNEFNKFKVSLGSVVPNRYRTGNEYLHGEYFIWQHNSASKNPNPLHLKEDGKIYQVGSNQWSQLSEKRRKGCMCVIEQVDGNKIEVI